MSQFFQAYGVRVRVAIRRFGICLLIRNPKIGSTKSYVEGEGLLCFQSCCFPICMIMVMTFIKGILDVAKEILLAIILFKRSNLLPFL